MTKDHFLNRYYFVVLVKISIETQHYNSLYPQLTNKLTIKNKNFTYYLLYIVYPINSKLDAYSNIRNFSIKYLFRINNLY